MARYDGQIPNFIGGVSQQPAPVRGISQFEEQENYYADPVEGLITRAPSEHVAALGIVADANAFTHFIDRGEGNRQLLVIDTTNGMRVFDLNTGVERTVTDNASDNYLEVDTPCTDLHALTEADTTFIINRNKVVAKTATTSATRPYEGVVYVRAGVYGEYYRVFLNGTEVYTKTSASDNDDVDVINIAKQLTGEIAHATYGGAGSAATLNDTDFPGYTFERIGSTIYISRGTDFTLSAGDGQGGATPSLVVAKGSIQDFNDLPRKCKGGMVIKVTGTPTAGFDDYWVKYTIGAGDDEGYWEETVAPGVEIELDASTLAHKLVPNVDGITFDYDVIEWTDREKGNDDANPFPSFIGNTISDLFFFRNRFCFTAGENVICSQEGEYYNFFRTTITDLLDGDRIDTPVPAKQVSNIKHAIPIGKDGVILSGLKHHFIFGSGRGQLLTPKNAAIDYASTFKADPFVTPVALGPYAYFAANGTAFARVNELYFDEDRNVQDAVDVCAAVPQYIPNDVRTMAGDTNDSVLAITTSGDLGKVYIWKYFWDGDKRVQSSWSKWNLGDHIINAQVVDGWLYVVRRVEGVGTYVERINIESGYTFSTVNYRINLDRLVDQGTTTSVTFDGTDSTVTLPYTLSGERVKVVVGPNTTRVETEVLFDGTVTGDSITVENVDLTTVDFYAGTVYECVLTLSEFFARDENGVSLLDQTLKLKKLNVAYTDTGQFKVEVTIGANVYTYVYSGVTVGDPGDPIGVFSLDRGTFIAPIGCDAEVATIKLIADSHYPAQFTHATWTGLYTRRK